ncbi:hypothetical protein [Kribbella solani]|uniref:Uncharacterized protein n=1 Tax=Kribbella solani TaxID=236067 RepID=A0A841DME5_9ACTN|nr:hypothetical protein [Kribbella solani]MBB5977830.1 hypothetical protein [Kribbella solani]MDX3006184.1 hypothetical protein [Kribbella solani]
MGNETSWREERRQAAAEHAAALERKKAAETARARELLRDFIATLKERGVEPEPLRAQVIGSNASYRTELVGWYLRRNRSLAVDVDGNFYILGVPASLKARVTGARVEASDPPLVVGQGARDGESMPLAELLQLRLDS